MQLISVFTIFLAQGLATKLLLPLYQYPEGTVWDTIYTSIAAHPQLEFQIILNVDSGPGGPEPNSDFATGVAKLNSYPNVETLGYVHVLYGEASTDEVAQNTSNWAAWNSYTAANTSISGIFFDETPNSQGSAGDNDVTFMRTVVEAASSAFGTHSFTSMMNPGSGVEHTEFWDIADYIVIFEDEASSYSSSVLTSNITPGKESQSAILIPEFAEVGTATEAKTWIQGIVEAGVASAHILDYGYIQATTLDEPAPLGSIAAALASGASSGAATVATSTVSKTTLSTVVTTSKSVSTTVTSSSEPDTTTTRAVTTSAKSSEATSTSDDTPDATTSSTHHHHSHWGNSRFHHSTHDD